MVTKTSEYAIRAMVYIARQGESHPVLARDVADETGVPANYVSKILRDLAQRGVLSSTRGVGGGFRLAKPLDRIRIRDIVTPFESPLRRDQCPFGLPVCSEQKPCSGHEYYRNVKIAYDKFLDLTTLKDVARTGGDRKAKSTRKRKKSKR